MKTIEQILQGEDCAINDRYTLEQAKIAMKEYAIEVLKEAAKKAQVETLMKNSRTKRFRKIKTEEFEFDPLNFEMLHKVNKSSILNIINQLK